jgi:FlaA1/EpsC-like NDP-sugar epimerase
MGAGSEAGPGGASRPATKPNRFARVSVRVAFDAVLGFAAFIAVFALDGAGFGPFTPTEIATAAVSSVVVVLALLAADAYGARRSEFAETAIRVGAATAVAAVVLVVLALMHGQDVLDPAGSLIAAAFVFPLLLFTRLDLRRSRRAPVAGAATTIIVGARDAAKAVIRLIARRTDLPFDVVGCVDDDQSVRSVEGVPLLGRMADLPRLVSERGIETVIVAATSAQPRLIKQVMADCSASAGKRPPVIKVIPHLDQLLTGHVKYSPVRDVRLDDLLLREPVEVDLTLVAPHLRNRVVLVTGAGGSIGSELCRQISRFEPKLLVMVGHGENSLFAIDHELRADLGCTNTRIVLADVADGYRIRSVFSQYRPHIVFHAAAHKHVPILESNVCEAVRNNVFGTHAVALAAAAAGVAKFVMISTDKAVNPTSIMGATKRVAEQICQSFERRTGTEFVSVRFGNVLGSRGSVIDVFTRQIEAGGPLTVTHPDMVRYFMTIPEAVALVLQATSIGRDGQVFVLDMGKPVSVVELAENLVRLCGLRPYEDIDIVFTGIRPGEKLREEILTPHELENPTRHSGENPTVHERLFVAQQERLEYEHLVDTLNELEVAVRTPDLEAVLATIRRLVPEFHPGPHHQAAESENGETADSGARPPGAVDEEQEALEPLGNVVHLESALAARSAAIDAAGSQAGVGTP